MSDARRRRGHAALVFLVLLPALLLVLLLVFHTAQVEQARAEVQQAADASAMAAALALVDDASLQADGRAMLPVLHAAQEEAVRYAGRNTVMGTPNRLVLTADNAEDGDLLFGIADSPAHAAFRVDLGDSELLPLINTVRVRVVRTAERDNQVRLVGGSWLNGRAGNITRSATAILDRAVVGFRPVVDKPLPVVPLALLSDPASRDSWEWQVEKGDDRTDEFRYLTEPYRALSDRGDGLYEMTVSLPRSDGAGGAQANCKVLCVGPEVGFGVPRQVREGIRADDLADYNRELVLGPGNRLPIPGLTSGSAMSGAAFNDLFLALKELSLTGVVRAWPLYDPSPTFEGVPVLSGFVAARVMQVGSDGEGGLRFVLQPACLHSASVVTAPVGEGDEADPAGRPQNRYVCKVRLAR